MFASRNSLKMTMIWNTLCRARSSTWTYLGTRGVSTDPATHTGQQWDDKDYRLCRFVDKEKTVNEKFAADLINKVPPAKQESRVVWCDGGGGPTGHPRVYINLDKPGNHSCGYCGLRFFKDDHHH